MERVFTGRVKSFDASQSTWSIQNEVSVILGAGQNNEIWEKNRQSIEIPPPQRTRDETGALLPWLTIDDMEEALEWQ